MLKIVMKAYPMFVNQVSKQSDTQSVAGDDNGQHNISKKDLLRAIRFRKSWFLALGCDGIYIYRAIKVSFLQRIDISICSKIFRQ